MVSKIRIKERERERAEHIANDSECGNERVNVYTMSVYNQYIDLPVCVCACVRVCVCVRACVCVCVCVQ